MKIPRIVNNVRSAALKGSQRFSFYTLHFHREGSQRFWEILGTERHRQGLLLFDVNSKAFVLTRKFRPALLSRHEGVQCEELNPEGIELSTDGCITSELFSCVAPSPENKGSIVSEVERELGCNLVEEQLAKVSSFRMWGENYHLFYASVNDIISDVPQNVHLVPLKNLDSFIEQSEVLSSDLILALEWWKWNKGSEYSSG
jgi:hypothetical protein